MLKLERTNDVIYMKKVPSWWSTSNEVMVIPISEGSVEGEDNKQTPITVYTSDN